MTTSESRRRASNIPIWLVAMTCVACLLNFVWLSYDTTPPQWDGAAHLLSAMRYRALLASLFHGNLGENRGVMYTPGRSDSPSDTPNSAFWRFRNPRDRALAMRSDALQNRQLLRSFRLPDGSELLVYR